MAYVETRMEDIAELESPLTMKNGIQFGINLSIRYKILYVSLRQRLIYLSKFAEEFAWYL